MKAKTRRRRMERRIIEGLLIGKSRNQLMRELRVCGKTVKRVRELAEQYGYLSGEVRVPAYPEAVFPDYVDGRAERAAVTDELLEPHLAWIRKRLKDWSRITVWEELPVRVPRASFYRFLKRHGLTGSRGRVVSEILSGPGESLQLDWGKLRTVEIDGKRRKVSLLTGVLSFSRYRMVRLVWGETVSETVAALSSMFEELGGVPYKLTTDNAKCLAQKASRYEPIYNPVMERFAAHYGVLLECLPPRSPELKGKVERQIPYMRRLYEAYSKDWWGLEHSQDYLNKKLVVANQQRHGTTRLRPAEVFEETERAALKPLPVEPYEVEEYHRGPVRKDGHVRFRNKYYSVEEQYIGREVVVIGNSSQVSIYCDDKLLEVHDRVTSPHQSKSTKSNHKRPWERTFEEHSVYRERARKIGGWVEELVITILAQGNGFVDFRKIWGILSLDKSFPANIIDQACMLAHDQERWSYHAVRELAEALYSQEQAESPAPEPAAAPKSAKFTHDIKQYTHRVQLSLIKGGADESRNSQKAVPSTENAHGGSRDAGCASEEQKDAAVRLDQYSSGTRN